MNKCLMCGTQGWLTYKWYQYDSGEQFLERVCIKCSDLHTKLTGGK